MNIFDKFLSNNNISRNNTPNTDKSHYESWDRDKRKAIGMDREKRAIKMIRQKLLKPNHFLHGIHFMEPNTNEICEVDGLYISNDLLCIVEIKSKNFDYMYGNTDTGYWHLEYNGRMVRSDNPFRQITRQMRIVKSNLNFQGEVCGIVFINNKNTDVRMDIVGPKIHNIRLEMSVEDVVGYLNSLPKNVDGNFIKEIRRIDIENMESGLYDGI